MPSRLRRAAPWPAPERPAALTGVILVSFAIQAAYVGGLEAMIERERIAALKG